jgi:hypothetical protein
MNERAIKLKESRNWVFHKKRHHERVVRRSVIDSTTADMHGEIRIVRIKSGLRIQSSKSDIGYNVGRHSGLVEDSRAWVCWSEAMQIEMPVESIFIVTGYGIIGRIIDGHHKNSIGRVVGYIQGIKEDRRIADKRIRALFDDSEMWIVEQS